MYKWYIKYINCTAMQCYALHRCEKERKEMNRLHLIILLSLQKINASSVPSAVTLYEIKDYCKIDQSITTLYRVMKSLYDMQYIDKGLKTINSHTFYINQNGIEKLKEMI